MLGHIHHLGSQNTGRTVHGGEGFVQLGHLAADGGLALHENDGNAAVGTVKGCLDAGHAAADDEHALGDVKTLGVQGTVVAQLHHCHADEFGSLVRVGFLVLANPGYMLAYVGHFKHVAVKAGTFYRLSECLLMHARGTGSHHNAGKLLFMDGFLNGRLAWFGTGVHQVRGVYYIGKFKCTLGSFGTVYSACDIASAVTDENAYSHAWPPCLILAAVLRALIFARRRLG